MKRKQVDHWIDGDSGFFTDGTPFRLARVNAPERWQRDAETATRMAASMTGRNNGYVGIRVLARDLYGRQVVEMRNQDGSINSRLLRKLRNL